MGSEINSESNPFPTSDSDSQQPQADSAYAGESAFEVSDGDVASYQDAAQPNQFLKLDERNIQVERISGLIFATVLFFGAIVGLVFLLFTSGLDVVWFIALAVGAVFVLSMFMLAICWPPLNYKNTSWRLDEEGLEIHRGVLWKHRVIIPLGRVQHADVSQGPLQRQFGVGTLTIHTAGTQHASIPLEGLTHETALQLRDLIVHQKKGQHVV